MYFLFFHILISCLAMRQQHGLIDWQPDRKLTWSDFKAPVPPGTPVAALTSTSIKIDYGYYHDSLYFMIHCRFDPSRSWGRIQSEYVLAHEQGHFDIAEIFARDLNRQLRKFRAEEETFKTKVYQVYQDQMEKFNAMEDEYDRETNFSMDREKQLEWLEKIRIRLEALSPYANYQRYDQKSP